MSTNVHKENVIHYQRNLEKENKKKSNKNALSTKYEKAVGLAFQQH